MENAVVYARYSSHSQNEQSIEGQIAAAKRYAESKGYNIIREYCDRAKTGTNDNRAEFQRMLIDTSSKAFTVIIVWKVDRFGRNREEIAFNKHKCKKNGVRVEYVAENIGTGPEGVILEAVLEGMAEYYSLQLSQNVKRGMYETAKKHLCLGKSVPLGYVPGPNKEYTIDPYEAAIVKEIYMKYLNGYSVSELIEYLNGHGYRTKTGNPFTKNSVPRILHNETYTGVYKYKDLIRDEDAVPVIIDKETFDKVQEMLSVNRRKPSKRWKYTDFILTDKLYCGHCGDKMFGQSGYSKTGKKYNYYGCHRKDIKAVRQDFIEELVVKKVKNIISDEETREYIVEMVWNYYEEQDTTKQEIENINKQIAETEKAILNLVSSVEQGMPYDLVKGRIAQLTSEKNDFEAMIANLKLESGVKLTKDHIRFFLEQFLDMDFDDRNCQKKLVEVLVNRIYVYDDYLNITLNYTEKGSGTAVEFDRTSLSGAYKTADELILIHGLLVLRVIR